MSHPLIANARTALGLSLAAAMTLVALSPPLPGVGSNGTGIVLVIGTLLLWASGALTESLTALLFLTLSMLGNVAPARVIFSGFASSAFWLVFSGLVVGAAITHNGLGARIAARLARVTGHSYAGAMIGTVLFGLVMAFLMPSSMGRMVLIIPIVAALADHLGLAAGNRGRVGLILGGVFGTFLPASAILPANVPNNVLAGIAETALGQKLAFADYLLIHFPVLGVLKTVVLIAILLKLFRGQQVSPAADPEAAPAGPLSAGERRLAVVLALALGLWATDSIHHIAPAWVGMAAAIICLLPHSKLLPPKALPKINLEPVFYVGAVISLGAVAARVGLSKDFATWAQSILALAPSHPIGSFIQMSGLSCGLGLLTTLPGVPPVLTPLAPDFAAASGLTIPAVLASQVVGFSTVILPYQAPPLAMAMQAADLPRREVVRLCLIIALVTLIVLWPIDFLWLHLLGRI